MRVVRVSAAVFLLLSSSVDLRSQQTTSTNLQRDAQAVSVLTQSLVTMGALASPTRSTVAQGIVSYPDGRKKSIQIETVGTSYVRNDVGTGEFSFISAAGNGRLILQGKSHALPVWITQYKRPDHLPTLGLMSDLQNPLLQAKYIGLEQVNGLPAHHIRLSMLPPDGTSPEVEDLISEFHVYIDQTSLLVVSTRSFNFSPEIIQNRSPVDTYYSDYRLQDGVLVPYRLIRFVDNRKDCEITFDSVSLNASVSLTDFQ